MKKNMIDANNAKLKFFHLIVSLAALVDFILTGLVISNYQLMDEEYDPDFVNNYIIYIFIITI